MINRFYEIQAGAITYDGIDIRRITEGRICAIRWRWSFRRPICLPGPSRTISAMEGWTLHDEEVREAARIANADSFIRRLPDGYDTMLHSDGSNLSQGQRQLLAIARAAVARPPVLILDEATSSVDTRTERLIEKGNGCDYGWPYRICDCAPPVYSPQFQSYYGAGAWGDH